MSLKIVFSSSLIVIPNKLRIHRSGLSYELMSALCRICSMVAGVAVGGEGVFGVAIEAGLHGMLGGGIGVGVALCAGDALAGVVGVVEVYMPR